MFNQKTLKTQGCVIYPLEKEDSEVQKQNYNLTQDTAEIRKRIKYLSEYLSK